ncbi:MAG: hypothetical protein RRY07_04405 [Bacteroidaceae bacterium]
MNEGNTNEKTLIDIEREELNLLVKRGVKFDVTYKIRRRKKGFRKFFQKKETIIVNEVYEIHEPTLSVLDQLSAVWVEMGIDEDSLNAGGTSTLVEAKQIAHENARRMARIIAIAVLGEDYNMTEVGIKGRIKSYQDDKELDRLTALFMHTIKPSKLVGLANTVTNVSNLGDFIGSMRLMSGARTTQPRKERIE